MRVKLTVLASAFPHRRRHFPTPTAGAGRSKADRSARVAAQLNRVRTYGNGCDGHPVIHATDNAV